MKTITPHTPARVFPLMGALGLAFLGQFLIIQKDNPATLLPALILYGLAVWILLRAIPLSTPEAIPSSKPFTLFEGIALSLIFIIAITLRLYRFDEFPNGLFTDEACSAWAGYKIAHENWNLVQNMETFFPFYPNYISNAYWSALWFNFFNPTQNHFYFLSVTLSLLAFPGIYWTFRQWSGPQAALGSLFILSVMRWHVTYSRSGHPAIEILIYIFWALAFWTKGLRTSKSWYFIPATLITAAGFLSYQAYYAFPIFLTLFLFLEWRNSPWKAKSLWMTLGSLYLTSLAVGWPYFHYLAQRGGPGMPGKGSAFFHFQWNGGDLRSLFDHCLESILQLNRAGDPWPIHNFPYHRLLDDTTGVFFILGLFLAWSRLPRRQYLYALLGFGVMSMPAFLSQFPISASRMIGTTPFIAFLAALALEAVFDQMKDSSHFFVSKGSVVFVTVLLGLMAYQNYYIYFDEQARNYDCRLTDSPKETAVGKTVAETGITCEDYLSSRFFGHYSVMFLGYYQAEHMHQWSLPESLSLPGWKPGQSVLFALEEGQTGVLGLVQAIYPGGEQWFLKDSQGHNIVYFYKISSLIAQEGRLRAQPFLQSDFGLWGSYWPTPDHRNPPILRHIDPLINFTFRNDFPFTHFPPLSVQWQGVFIPPVSGKYQFLFLSTNPAQLKLDRNEVLSVENWESNEIYLKKGSHSLEVDFDKATGIDTVLNLLWKMPGETKYEVIPYSAFKRHF
jgi:hypothetical protein